MSPEKTEKKAEKKIEIKETVKKETQKKVKPEKKKVEKKIEIKREITMKGTHLKPIMTEKAVMMIERDNALVFQTSMKHEKKEIKEEIEEILDVKIKSIRTLIKNNKKYVYTKLAGDTLAIDVATKLGLM